MRPDGGALLDGITVVYLEDHEDTREMMTTGLARHGARVFATDSAQYALLLLEAERPDVVIADLELPEIDGWTFMQAARELTIEQEKRTLAIALTGHNTPADRLKSLSAGFTLHVAKPVSPDQLATRIVLLLRPPAAT